MLTVELKFKIDGREVSVESIAHELVSRFVHSLGVELRKFGATAPLRQTPPPANQSTIQPRAVGVNEAAQLLGLSDLPSR